MSLSQHYYEMEVFSAARTSSSASLVFSGRPHQDVSPANFAFLNHSQQTIPQNLPPNVDNKPLARQKRRRTSPEDAAILEAEFQRDSKPDKMERGRIAERVALGEKEVQIWFQNRRSTTRRRARPLTPPVSSKLTQYHNDAALDRNEIHMTRLSGTESTLPPYTRERNDKLGAVMSLDGFVSQDSDRSEVDTPQQSEQRSYRHSQTATSGFSASSPSSETPVECPGTTNRPGTDQTTTGTKTVETVPLNAENSDNDPSVKDSHSRDTDNCAVKPTASIRRRPSGVRLSMTSEGLATILGEDEASPSPPRLTAGLNRAASSPRGLRRSYSAAGFGEPSLPGQNNRTKSGFERSLSGRSRDSRSWEFWCDSEARGELAKKADQETTGSAADAISLMRSTSRNALIPNQNKGNTRDGRRQPMKRSKSMLAPSSRPHLGRAASSVARLQSGVHDNSVPLDNPKHHKPGMEGVTMSEVPGSDSDKENKEPFSNEPTNVRNTNSASQRAGHRQVLGESRGLSGQARRRDLLKQGTQEVRKSDRPHHLNFNPIVEVDQEVARFMSGEGVSNASRQSDDLDCIQGLLSLSQGAWR